MTDQENARSAEPESEAEREPAIDTTERGDQPFGDLSEAARGVVHSPADPRLERHLERIGLGEASRSRAARGDDVSAEQLARLQASIDIANWRIRVVMWLVVAIAVAIVVLAILVVSR